MMRTPPLQLGAYYRVSKVSDLDDPDDPDSLRRAVIRQREDLDLHAARLGVEIARRFEDNDLSAAGTKKRPDYQEMLESLRSGALDGVMATEVSRYQRGHKEYVEFYELCERLKLKVYWLGGCANFETGEGILEFEVHAMFAREELRKLRWRVARKHRELAHRGKWSGGGLRPFGYEAGCVALREPEAELIRDAARRVLAEEPLSSICTEWNRKGITTATGKLWGVTTLYKILASARISGRREHHGIITSEAEWPATIPPAQSDRLREKLKRPGKPRTPSANFLVGIAHCGNCGQPLYSCGAGKNGERRMGCSALNSRPGCGRVSIMATPLERVVTAATVKAIAGGALADILNRETGEEATELENELRQVRHQQAQLAAMWGQGQLSVEEWAAAKAPLVLREQDLRKRLSQAQTVELGFDVENPLDIHWTDRNLAQRRRIVQLLVRTVTVGPSTQGPGKLDLGRIKIEWAV